MRLVPEEGVEPTHPCGQRILSPPRLPFRHSGTSQQKYHVSRHSAKRVPTNVIPEFTPRIKLSGVLDASSPERYSVGSRATGFGPLSNAKGPIRIERAKC